MANPCLQPNQSDFRGYPGVEYTETKTQAFQRNNCSGGQTGSWVNYSKTYTSYVGEDDLQDKISADEAIFNAAGQANANSNGTCSASCTTIQSVATYNLAAMSSSQIWLNDWEGRLINPYTKSSVLGGTSMSNGTLIKNDQLSYAAAGYGWQTIWPYSYSDNMYYLQEPSTVANNKNIYLVTKNITSGNACTSDSGIVIYTKKHTKGRGWVADRVITPKGILMVIGYDYSSSLKNFDVVWYSFSTASSSIIYTVHRPHNYKYSANTGAIAYNGETAYLMLSFKSKNSAGLWGQYTRTRTTILQVLFSLGEAGSVVTYAPFDYANRNLQVMAGCHAGSKLFFLYYEDKHVKVYPILGGAVSSPAAILDRLVVTTGSNEYPLIVKQSSFRDIYSTQNCYVGARYPRLLRYTANTDTWANLV